MGKPVIGVLGNLHKDPNVSVSAQMTYVNSAYLNAVRDNGGIPFMIPVMGGEEELDRLLALCDGLLFPGGQDVDPKLFGEAPHPSIGTVNERMDRFWVMAERKAEELGLPVLGICRGMQLINIARGGSLYQDVTLMPGDRQMHAQKQNRDYPVHQVKVEENTELRCILGTGEIYTNTMHHQCVKAPGKGLTVTAHAQDGVPEAMETEDKRVILVQWHPEELVVSVPEMNRLFGNLVEKAGRRTR